MGELFVRVCGSTVRVCGWAVCEGVCGWAVCEGVWVGCL